MNARINDVTPYVTWQMIFQKLFLDNGLLFPAFGGLMRGIAFDGLLCVAH